MRTCLSGERVMAIPSASTLSQSGWTPPLFTIFGTLFVFGLIGLVVGILSDLMYVAVDPRIDFERREG